MTRLQRLMVLLAVLALAPVARAEPQPVPVAAAPAPMGCREVTATVSIAWRGDALAAAVGIGLRYPGDKLEIPGSGNDESVRERVENVSGVSTGLFERVDIHDPAGGAAGSNEPLENRVNAGLVVVPAAIHKGDVIRVRFLCRPGHPRPADDDLTCTGEVGDQSGQQLGGPSCAVKLVISS